MIFKKQSKCRDINVFAQFLYVSDYLPKGKLMGTNNLSNDLASRCMQQNYTVPENPKSTKNTIAEGNGTLCLLHFQTHIRQYQVLSDSLKSNIHEIVSCYVK